MPLRVWNLVTGILIGLVIAGIAKCEDLLKPEFVPRENEVHNLLTD